MAQRRRGSGIPRSRSRPGTHVSHTGPAPGIYRTARQRRCRRRGWPHPGLDLGEKSIRRPQSICQSDRRARRTDLRKRGERRRGIRRQRRRHRSADCLFAVRALRTPGEARDELCRGSGGQ